MLVLQFIIVMIYGWNVSKCMIVRVCVCMTLVRYIQVVLNFRRTSLYALRWSHRFIYFIHWLEPLYWMLCALCFSLAKAEIEIERERESGKYCHLSIRMD